MQTERTLSDTSLRQEVPSCLEGQLWRSEHAVDQKDYATGATLSEFV